MSRPAMSLRDFVEHLDETNQHIARVINTEEYFVIRLGQNGGRF